MSVYPVLNDLIPDAESKSEAHTNTSNILPLTTWKSNKGK